MFELPVVTAASWATVALESCGAPGIWKLAPLRSVIAQTGVPRVDIVGHSMGGLVGLYYLKRLGGRHRVRRLVLLGTPARGTWSALLGLFTAPIGLASLQLLPGSQFLRDLADTPIPDGIEVTSIGAERDWLAPVDSTVLAGVRHLSVPTGHSGLLVEEDVADVVAQILQAPDQAPDQAPNSDGADGERR